MIKKLRKIIDKANYWDRDVYMYTWVFKSYSYVSINIAYICCIEKINHVRCFDDNCVMYFIDVFFILNQFKVIAHLPNNVFVLLWIKYM